MPTEVACPTCAARVKWIAENRYRPFCSERCKQIDLGAWAAGDYAIPVPPANEEEISQLEQHLPTDGKFN